MSARGVSPSIITLNAAVSSCESTGQWQRAINLLGARHRKQNSADFGELLDATRHHVCVLEVEKTVPQQIHGFGPSFLVRRFNLSSDVVSFSAAVSSSGASGKWTTALGLAWDMRTAAVRANVITCNSLVSVP